MLSNLTDADGHGAVESPFGTPGSRTGLGSMMSRKFVSYNDSTEVGINRAESQWTAPTDARLGNNEHRVDVFDDEAGVPLLADDHLVESTFTFAQIPADRESSDQGTPHGQVLSQASSSLEPFKAANFSRAHSSLAGWSTGTGYDGSLEEDAESTAPTAPLPNTTAQNILVGVVNSVVAVPVMLSFTAIIFQVPLYRPVLGQLVRLVFLSGAVHQLVFVMKSTLPFAIGQVQDVGLIFLSAMASSIAQMGTDDGMSVDNIVATTLLSITLSTAIVGLLIILTGYLKLAQMVQYVPLPVVGGYLGFVGYFCMVSGISLATGVHVASPASWLHLLNKDALIKLGPVIAAWLALWLTTQKINSPLALPATLCFIPATFYIGLAVLGKSLTDAQEAGWVIKPQSTGAIPFWEIWNLYNWKEFPQGVGWRYMPQQAGLLVALFFVVAFGSSMDVAAIQQDYPEPLDYNKELVTVGISNLITGVSGCGFTGSYIFSQTVFSMRMGVRSRIAGCLVTITEFVLFALPVSIIQYMPNYFYGGLMMWIGIDIFKDWLIMSYKKVMHIEFVLVWSTFALIWVFGLEIGIGAGIVLACLHFSYSYAKVQVHAFAVVPSRSGSMRTLEERMLLELLSKRITAVALSGYIFFGSSIKISDKVLKVAKLLSTSDESVARLHRNRRLPSTMDLAELEFSHLSSLATNIEALTLEGSSRGKAYFAFSNAPRFMLLDFRRVTGLDATAARTFATLAQRLSSQEGIQLIITHIHTHRPEIKRLLQGHGVIGEETSDDSNYKLHMAACRCFPSMEDGLSYCEERLLEYARERKLLPPATTEMNLAQLLRAHMALPAASKYNTVDTDQVAEELEAYLVAQEFKPGDVLFDVDAPSDELYFIQHGTVALHMSYSGMKLKQEGHAVNPTGLQKQVKNRVFRVFAGGILGEMDFFLFRKRTFTAVAEVDTRVWSMSRSAMERMGKEEPYLLSVIQMVYLRQAAMSLSHTVDILEKADLE